MQKIMISMPDDLAEKLRWAFPAQQRSEIIAGILSAEITRRDQELHKIARMVESDDVLNNEMAEWEEATIEDGIQPESW